MKHEHLTPRQIVASLDRHIVGQGNAKKAVALALRSRWRRQQLSSPLREEVLPKNILLIGPTGVGKTEIARRLSQLAEAPFIKVEATRFTEVGYVGRDVEQIIRDLVEIAISDLKEQSRARAQEPAQESAEKRILAALIGEQASEETRERFRSLLTSGDLEDREIEVDVSDGGAMNLHTVDVPGMPGAQMGMFNLGDLFNKMMGGRSTRKRRMKVSDARRALIQDESEKLLDHEKITREAIQSVEQQGIVFLDEIDKICARVDRSGAGDVSREGVQRDLLPLIEGTTVPTKHGTVKTDHILFIASGAFHVAKPSDLLPELQGRLPIRVELQALSEEDFVRILTEPESSLIKQYTALLATEGVTLSFEKEALYALARSATKLNDTIENIGARRLHTVMERLLEEISFSAEDQKGETVVIDAPYVEKTVAELAKNTDLSRFIL